MSFQNDSRPCSNIEEDLKPVERNGLLYYQHGTNITVICLLPNHPALKTPIEKVTYFRYNGCVSGKGKKVSNFSCVLLYKYSCSIL